MKTLVYAAAIFLALSLTTYPAAAPALVLADEHGPRLVIVQPLPKDRTLQLAAREIATHIHAITGTRPPIAKAPVDGKVPIHLQVEPAPDTSRESFTLTVTADHVRIVGASSTGTLHGTYAFLEALGIRWYMPGDLGRVLPPGPHLSLPHQQLSESPSFVTRGISGAPTPWRQRSRFGGEPLQASLSFPPPAPFAERPELYALVNGKRNPQQLCVSNPETLRLEAEAIRAIFAKRPNQGWAPVSNHGQNHCQCPDCRALDPPDHNPAPFTGGLYLNDRYIHFCNQLLDLLATDYPDKRLTLTVCTPQFDPPRKIKGHPRLDIVAWANGFCRFHGVDNPVCTERQHVLQLEKQWVKSLHGNFYERTNWGNIAGPGLYFPAVHRYRRDFPAYHAAGVRGVRGSDYSHLISQVPSSYIGARLLWNHQADVDQILDEFYPLFYGPAATPMRQFHELLETTVRDAPYHAGTAVSFPRIYTPEIRQQAQNALDTAARLATAPPYSTRIQAHLTNLQYLHAFCDMIAARDACQFAQAKAALDRCLTHIATLQDDYQPPLLRTTFTPTYLNLFFGKSIAEAARLTTTDGTIVAAFKPTWDFRLDADKTWRPMPTWTSSWRAQGLAPYDGFVWYRQDITIPGPHRPLHLWFGGIDEQATIWLNGTQIGTHHGAFQTFQFDITEHAKLDQPNTLLIRLGNLTLDEVGTGGLLAPVIIYTPTP